ncbi:HDOD domain-containing protein [Noviherbaspirillum soli]|uniref:HDOD domain-containing protein n=1 Tax=Noviherbaspirillum soli TaxID=1064518 RepID=UPI00188A48C4|nr:HDOD domain-containing protein [Noviherbaspirillum soli]
MTENGPDTRAARDRLLWQVTQGSELPALGASVSEVVRMASAEDDSVRELASFLLNDVALTQKMLRLANTASYRTAGGMPVTTISRAIFLLGFETVKTSALAMLLVDGMKGRKGQSVRNELSLALCASVFGRAMARRAPFKDAEEAAVAALFKNLGRVLVAAHDHLLYGRIAELAESAGLSQSQSSARILGCSFDDLTETALRSWNMPDSIVHALAPLPAGMLKPARSRAEWMQQVAGFSASMAALLPRMTDPGKDADSRAVLARYGAALNLDAQGMAELVQAVATEARALRLNADIVFKEDAIAEPVPVPVAPQSVARADPLAEFLMAGDSAAPSAERHPSGKPVQARELLMAGAQSMSEMIASGAGNINDLMFLALETLYAGMGFRYATVCLRDMQTGLYKSRLALGTATPRLQRHFAFAASGNKDLFFLSMQNNADLLISDASTMKIASLLPVWHRTMLPEARSFIILPLVVKGAPVGYFYADRTVTAPEGITPEETSLLRMIKSQVIARMAARVP